MVIGFDPEFPEHLPKMEHARSVQAVRRAVAEALGDACDVRFTLLKTSDILPADHAVGGPPAPDAVPPVEERAEPKGRDGALPPLDRRTPQDWMNDPVVRKVLEALNGEVIDVRT